MTINPLDSHRTELKFASNHRNSDKGCIGARHMDSKSTDNPPTFRLVGDSLYNTSFLFHHIGTDDLYNLSCPIDVYGFLTSGREYPT